MEVLEALKTYFGYADFRPGQAEIVSAVLSGRDVAAVMPTGAGKSLCFQLPALLLPGISLVISPLISLMKDQVAALVQAGVPAAFFNSSLTERQYTVALERAKAGRYKIIYVAPERLETERFLDFARRAEISLLAVDEAHCVSQWGQDFRPHYLQIPAFADRLRRRPVVAAFTATATAQVRSDIRELLALRSPLEVVTGFDRSNLYFEVRRGSAAEKRRWLGEITVRHRGECGIIYCATRRSVEAVCDLLRRTGVPATRYHAGLDREERQRNQEDFLYDRSPVMVATNAFGMGIDKSNVRYVVHYNMPRDMESYYQEAGRAGRDGEHSECILLYSKGDEGTARYLIEQDRENETLDAETLARIKERDYQRLHVMTSYCHTSGCLRSFILRYFGERGEAACGNCGNCIQDTEDMDITREARAILSCVGETGQRFGAGLLSDVLRGRRTQRVTQWQLEETEHFGALKQCKKAWIDACIQVLLAQELLVQREGPYPVLALSEAAGPILDGYVPCTMPVAKQNAASTPADVSAASAGAEDSEALLRRLRALRNVLARRQGVPAYIVFSDAALRDMCEKRPRTEDEFLGVSGVGRTKLEKYGAAFLAEISRRSE